MSLQFPVVLLLGFKRSLLPTSLHLQPLRSQEGRSLPVPRGRRPRESFPEDWLVPSLGL